MKKLLSVALLAGSLAVPATAAAAPPNPFGHACSPQNGVLFCPTASDSQRVPSFDGVPLDVDVTLPVTGDGPFPAIVMLHGYGGDKGDFESATPQGSGGTTFRYNNNFYAKQGYAVINTSARGFGRSCGKPDSRTAPACDRGWIHLADQRYEARDTQHLLGLLADQGLVQPRRIGATGISYGGIQTQILARLRDRVRLTNGSFVPWRSPEGKPMRITAGWSRWGASDLLYSLAPNGRFLDFRGPRRNQSLTPAGVKKDSYVNGLFALGKATGYVAPVGADPTADLEGWKDALDRGEPYRADVRAIGRQIVDFHSATSLSGVTAPLLLQSGWTDDLFGVSESLRVYSTFEDTKGARVSLQFGDLGHSRGSNKRNSDRAFNNQGAAFFGAHLKGVGRAPAHRSVTAFTQTCPKAAPAGGPFRASSWERLRRGVLILAGRRSQRVTSKGGNPGTAARFDQVIGGDACLTVKRERAAGTAVYESRMRRALTLIGLPTVSARVRTVGRNGQLVGRLWDVFGAKQRLISRGVYRLTGNQRGRIVFQLSGNGYRIARGHRVKLELLGRDPGFLRPSNGSFSVRVSRVVAQLPVRERGPRGG